MPRWSIIALSVTATCGALFGVWIWTRSMGHSAIEKIARERGLCHIEDCPDGVDYVLGVLSEKYELSSTTIEWCVGVDDWRRTRVYRGGLFKSILVDVMDTPCGPMHAPKTIAE